MTGNNSKIQEIQDRVPAPPVAGGKADFSKKVKEVFGARLPKNEQSGEKTAEASSEKKPEYEGQQTEKLYDIKDIAKNLTPKKILKLLILVVLLVLVLMALYVKFIKKGNVRPPDIMIDVPRPTSSDLYQKYKPSIYAEDTNFKKIDEGLSVLQNEAQSVILEEKSLLPPKVDFNITFN